MIEQTEILTPVVVLVAWSMLMWLWMYATRIPAIMAMRMRMDSNALRGTQMATLPANVRWKADNYNHLMEQPTVFYALAIALALLGEGTGLNVWLAWAYVVLRIVHSLVQVFGNKIMLRFAVFTLSNVPLFVLTARSITASLG